MLSTTIKTPNEEIGRVLFIPPVEHRSCSGGFLWPRVFYINITLFSLRKIFLLIHLELGGVSIYLFSYSNIIEVEVCFWISVGKNLSQECGWGLICILPLCPPPPDASVQVREVKSPAIQPPFHCHFCAGYLQQQLQEFFSLKKMYTVSLVSHYLKWTNVWQRLWAKTQSTVTEETYCHVNIQRKQTCLLQKGPQTNTDKCRQLQ